MLEACNFFKKRLWHRYFAVNIAKFLRTPFLKEHLWTTASVFRKHKVRKHVLNDGFDYFLRVNIYILPRTDHMGFSNWYFPYSRQCKIVRIQKILWINRKNCGCPKIMFCVLIKVYFQMQSKIFYLWNAFWMMVP